MFPASRASPSRLPSLSATAAGRAAWRRPSSRCIWLVFLCVVWRTLQKLCGAARNTEHEAPGDHGAGALGGLIAARPQRVKGKPSGVPPPPVIDFYQRLKSILRKTLDITEREYHQKWFHVKVCLPVVPFAILAGFPDFAAPELQTEPPGQPPEQATQGCQRFSLFLSGACTFPLLIQSIIANVQKQIGSNHNEVQNIEE